MNVSGKTPLPAGVTSAGNNQINLFVGCTFVTKSKKPSRWAGQTVRGNHQFGDKNLG
jgi:hypothetical protein